MSEMSLFQNGSALPAHLQRGELSETTRALMGGSLGKRISIEGGVYRLIVGGQEVAVNEDRAMNVIIVRAADANSRTFYEGTYVKGAKAKPMCWSHDSVSPAPDVKNPQASKCATCPQNVKGSGVREGTRACRYQRRLAVLLENDIQGDVYAMTIPAASIFDQGEGRKMGLQQYARFLGGHGTDVTAVVTELRFDTQSEGVKLTFSAVRPTTEEEWAAVLNRKNDPAAIEAVTMLVNQIDGDMPVTASAPAPAPVAAKPATPAPVAKPAAPAAAAKPASKGFAVTKAEPAAAPDDEPTVRETTKPTPVVTDVNSILGAWGEEADD